MTSHQKLIHRAKKVAALLTSPIENEAKAASEMLYKILDVHKIPLSELGLSTIDINHLANKVNTTIPKDVDRTTGANHVVPETGNSRIKEFIYMHPIANMELWFLSVIVMVARAHGVWIIGDRYGMWSEKSHYLKIVGFPSDLKNMKITMVSLRKFIGTQISKRGYVDQRQVISYASGIISTFISRIREEIGIISKSKSKELADYVYKNYSLTSDSDPFDIDYDWTAYRIGQLDGYKYFTSSRLAYCSSVEKCTRG